MRSESGVGDTENVESKIKNKVEVWYDFGTFEVDEEVERIVFTEEQRFALYFEKHLRGIAA